MKFIYIATQHDKELMDTLGYHLLKSDDTNSVWIYSNQAPSGEANFAVEDHLHQFGVTFVVSDVLTF